jgi:hypothetical protein
LRWSDPIYLLPRTHHTAEHWTWRPTVKLGSKVYPSRYLLGLLRSALGLLQRLLLLAPALLRRLPTPEAIGLSAGGTFKPYRDWTPYGEDQR